MLFNSFEFLFGFAPVTLAGFFLLARGRPRLGALWLAAASLWFYAQWDVRFLPLLLTSIVFNFLAGSFLARRAGAMARSGGADRTARAALIGALAVNLAALGVFKYLDFFVSSTNQLFGLSMPAAGLVLPLGISFYTFTQIAFLVDAYRGEAREYRFLHYLLFVTWFPHLIAGPILHHRQLMPQFDRAEVYRWSSSRVASGLFLFTLGLAKKVLIADSMAGFATPGFSAAAQASSLTTADAWTAALGFTFQLYFDFSGYSDMAVGLSRLFGIELPINFNSPYKAANISDFWRRWHMTLSAFLRDYVYVPLGGNRRGEPRRYVNLLVTMLLGGLWHGANWTFVIWGGFHGVLLALHHAWRAWRHVPRAVVHEPSLAGRFAGTTATFLLVVIGWVIFKSQSMGAVSRMLSAMMGVGADGGVFDSAAWSQILLCAILVFAFPNSNEILDLLERHADASGWRGLIARALGGPLGGAIAGALFIVSVARLTSVASEFLYFQF